MPCAVVDVSLFIMAAFDGKTLLITGGGSGIGLATARQLVDAGANVVLAGRRVETIDAAAKELDPSGDRVLAVSTDVSRLDDLDELVDGIRGRFGRLDGIFANAGMSFASELDEASFDRMVSVNFKGAFFTVEKSLPLFDAGGSIVFNGTCIVHRGMGVPLSLGTVYAATKAAVTNLTRSLSADLATRGIRVNAVSPGFIDTEMFDELAPTEEARESCRGLAPLARLGTPEEVADAVTFLLSPQAAFITGQDLGVDGGLVSSLPMGGTPEVPEER
jgi:NAD(P)-dependent dehydrogenase (short-subunit alcohol dehydrogenase family)